VNYRLGALLASAVLAVLLLAPAGASATNTIECLGSTALNEENPAPDYLSFKFRCSEEITGFAITTNRELAGFEPEVLVTIGTTTDPAQGESFGCEGSIPSFGFGCVGTASAWNSAHGAFHTSVAACSRKEGPLLPRLVVTDSDKRISQVFALRSPKCPKPKKPKHKNKHPKRNHAAKRHG
jgi:hypothetical protein